MPTRHKQIARILLILLCALTVALLGATTAFLIVKYAPHNADVLSEATEEDTTDAPTFGASDAILLSETPDAGR